MNDPYKMSVKRRKIYESDWGAMGAPPVAESSDLSEWLRSVCNAGAPSPRRTQGTATGIVRRVEECVIIGQTA